MPATLARLTASFAFHYKNHTLENKDIFKSTFPHFVMRLCGQGNVLVGVLRAWREPVMMVILLILV